MKVKFLSLLLVSLVAVSSCKKNEEPEPEPAPTPTATAPKKFLNLTFNPQTAYFSTDGSMSAPVDSNTAKPISNKIDITFFFNYDYTEPGFLDPKTRSQHWYWDEYYHSWLSNSVETRFYTTSLTKTDFDAAAADQSKIAGHFSNATLAPHAIFPTGSCIGGRQSSNPTSVTLSMGQVYLFKNSVSGKRGMLYIRTDQSQFWPMPISDTNTKVDIIREN